MNERGLKILAVSITGVFFCALLYMGGKFFLDSRKGDFLTRLREENLLWNLTAYDVEKEKIESQFPLYGSTDAELSYFELYFYDARGQLVNKRYYSEYGNAPIFGTHRETDYSYDGEGRLTEEDIFFVSGPRNGKKEKSLDIRTKYQYGEDGYTVSKEIYPDSSSYTVEIRRYDKEDRLLSETEGRSLYGEAEKRTDYFYDGEGRLEKSVYRRQGSDKVYIREYTYGTGELSYQTETLTTGEGIRDIYLYEMDGDRKLHGFFRKDGELNREFPGDYRSLEELLGEIYNGYYVDYDRKLLLPLEKYTAEPLKEANDYSGYKDYDTYSYDTAGNLTEWHIWRGNFGKNYPSGSAYFYEYDKEGRLRAMFAYSIRAEDYTYELSDGSTIRVLADVEEGVLKSVGRTSRKGQEINRITFDEKGRAVSQVYQGKNFVWNEGIGESEQGLMLLANALGYDVLLTENDAADAEKNGRAGKGNPEGEKNPEGANASEAGIEQNADAAAGGESGGMRTEPAPDGSIYTVEKGDYLWKIADEYYGDGFLFEGIYFDNRELIGDNPGLILPGMKLYLKRE